MPTGSTKARGAVHRDGDWHGALHIWVGGIGSDGRAFALFQRRSATKDTWPGVLDVAVGGHLRAGETLADAVREADEEIGLAVRLDALVPLGRRWRHADADAEGVADNEVQLAVAVRSDLPLEAYRLHPDEVDAVVTVPLDTAIAVFEGRAGGAEGRELRRGDVETAPVHLTVDAFAAGEVGGYAALALRGLAEVIAGSRPAPFALR